MCKTRVFRFSGVRPLAYTGSAKTTGQITRDHHIQVLEGEWTRLGFPIHSMVGGKWTSFRAFAEQVTDKALAFLGSTRVKATHEISIGGGRNYPRTPEEQKRTLDGMTAWMGSPVERAQSLFDRYGTRAESVALFIAKQADKPLRSLPDYSQREIAFLALNEKIVHLDDLILRRTVLAKLGQLTRPALDELADVVGESLGWSDVQKKGEILRVLGSLAENHGVVLTWDDAVRS